MAPQPAPGANVSILVAGSDAAMQISAMLQHALVARGCAVTTLALADQLARVESAAVCVVEVDGDGLSAATRGAMRRGELDHLRTPEHACEVITVASSACRNSAASLKPCALAQSAKLAARLRASGAAVRGDALYLDVGVDTDVEETIDAFAQALASRVLVGTPAAVCSGGAGGNEGAWSGSGDFQLPIARPDQTASRGRAAPLDECTIRGIACALGRFFGRLKRAALLDSAGGHDRDRAILGALTVLGGGLGVMTLMAAAAAAKSRRQGSR